MWLLSTDRAELHFFPSVEAARRAGYAILSHTWDDTEQSFEETPKAPRGDEDPPGVETWNPRARASPKVRNACIVAERDGYRWLWDDTCCIDKASSAELSEAINSMFSYYTYAEVCYAYLGDVPPGTPMTAPETWYQWQTGSTLAASRWFTRGWTLQELIAPADVIFLSSDWTFLGTKAENADVLERITGIPAAILTLREEVWDTSIGERVSWASRRKTTRLEDEAHALMGIFDVHMPTIYGEGKNAFRRLQEEIMRKSSDSSLFAWGRLQDSLPAHAPFACLDSHDLNEMYLLATSPRDFDHFVIPGSPRPRYVFAPTRRYTLRYVSQFASSASGRY